MKTEELIETLSAHATPVTRVAPQRIRFARLVLMSCGWLLFIFGIRAAFSSQPLLPHPVSLPAVLLLAGVIGTALSSSAWFAVPRDAAGRSGWPVLFLGGWLAYLLFSLGQGSSYEATFSSGFSSGFPCALEITLFSLLPIVFAVREARRAAPTRSQACAFSIFLAGAAIGALLIELFCPFKAALHTLLWHFLPVAALAVTGLACARRALRW